MGGLDAVPRWEENSEECVFEGACACKLLHAQGMTPTHHWGYHLGQGPMQS